MKKLFIFLILPASLLMAQTQKNIQRDFLHDRLIPVDRSNSATARQVSTIDCTNPNYLYCEDFESITPPNLPSGITTSSQESNYVVPFNNGTVNVDGFYTGDADDANQVGYWPVQDHTQFAMTNDDACLPNGATPNVNNNCDLSFEVLQLPMLDMSSAQNLYLTFDYHHDGKYIGGDAVVEYKVGQGNWTNLTGNLPKGDSWQEGIFSLSALNNTDSVFIRFIWSDNNRWVTGFAVDNITVRKLNDNELSIQTKNQFLFGSAFHSTYSKVPLSQVGDGFFCRSIIRNVGNNAQDSVRLKADVGTFETQSWAKNLASLERDTFYTNTDFVPTAVGNYQFNFQATSDSVSLTSPDNLSVELTEFIYARDSDQEDISAPCFSSNTGDDETIEHGCSFDIRENAMLYAVDVFVSQFSDPDGKLKAKIYKINNSGESPIANFQYESHFKAIESVNSWQTVAFPQPFSLEAGIEWMVTISGDGTSTDTTRVGLSSAISGSFGWRIFNGFTPQGQTEALQNGIFNSIPMVRMNFNPNALNISEEESLDFSIFPNPSNGQFRIEASSSENKAAILSVKDVLGKTILSEPVNLVNNFSKDMDLSQLTKGVYFIHLSANSESEEIQKVIIH